MFEFEEFDTLSCFFMESSESRMKPRFLATSEKECHENRERWKSVGKLSRGVRKEREAELQSCHRSV